MTKDDRYGAVGDSYGTSGDTYGRSNGSRQKDSNSATDENPNGETSDGAKTNDGSTNGGKTNGDKIDDGGTNSDSASVAELPFIFARRTVKADRDALPVYVREATASDIDELERELDAQFDGDDVMSLDVREAVVKAGLRNVDDVVDVMKEWGYGRR